MSATELSQEVPARRKVTPIQPNNVTFLDQRQVKLIAIVPRGTTREDMMESAFWTSVAHRLEQLFEITVIDEAKTFYAHFLVLEASPIFTAVHLLDWFDLPGIISDSSDMLVNFSIEWSQSVNGYQARRLSDSVILVHSASSKEKCIEELLMHPAFSAEKK